MKEYTLLILITLLPVIASALLYLADKKTSFGKLSGITKQIIYGLVFGGLAILSTEYGVPLNGAQINSRDASVLCAGLLFGGPAGIIAGTIGGLERWICVAWGVGVYTRVACSTATFLAGLYAAALRKFLFENKKPSWLLSFAIGVVMEIFHLTMVVLTHMEDPDTAMNVVKACSLPLVLVNATAVMAATLLLTVLMHERFFSSRENARISQTIQRWLLITVLAAFVATTTFVYQMQNSIASKQADMLLKNAVSDVSDDVSDAADRELLATARDVASRLGTKPLTELAADFGLSEISIVDKDGFICDSTSSDYLHFNMASGEQSSEFLCLLDDTTEFVQECGAITSSPTLRRKYAGIKLDEGFLQVGYNVDLFQNTLHSHMVNITRNRHVGETGYVVIFDDDLNVVSSPENKDKAALKEAMQTLAKPAENTVFRMKIGKEPCYACYTVKEEYYLLSVLPTAEADRMRNDSVIVNSFMEILVFAVLFAFIYLIIRWVVVNRIKKINDSLAKITDGDLNEVVDVRSNEEFASLSDDINTTVRALKRYADEAEARIEKELELAKNIQAAALPNITAAFPRKKEFSIYASMNTAKEVGGDFYDFYFTRPNLLNFLIADVSGKGIPAAMFMMRAKTELKSRTERDIPLQEVFTKGNTALCEGNDVGMFLTAWQGSLDLDTGLVRYVSAGHNPPLIRRGNGKFAYLKGPPGFILAGLNDVVYRAQELRLEPGDVIFLYTDGVTEATNNNHKLFGEERLLDTVNGKEFTDMKELCDAVHEGIDTFTDGAPQFDDITMVALRYDGNKPPEPEISFDRASIDDIPAVTEFVEAELEKLECPMGVVTKINIAIDELYSNIAKFSYENGEGKVAVRVTSEQSPRSVSITFIDYGIPYDPLSQDDPDVTLSVEERDIGGLGIYMVKNLMDDVRYRYEKDQNILTITKKW